MGKFGACLLFDTRRLERTGPKLLVRAECLTHSGLDGFAFGWHLLLPERSRYPKYHSGVCSAAPLANGGLLTAGHCIRKQKTLGSVLSIEHLTTTLWTGSEIVTAQQANEGLLQLDENSLWSVEKLLAGRFRPAGPDWALLRCDHNLPGYALSEQAPHTGEVCHIHGYPNGLSLRHVASAKVIPPVRESAHFFWLDCQISNGVSGAPVSNEKGELVGIACGNTTTDNGIYTRVQVIPEEVKANYNQLDLSRA